MKIKRLKYALLFFFLAFGVFLVADLAGKSQETRKSAAGGAFFSFSSPTISGDTISTSLFLSGEAISAVDLTMPYSCEYLELLSATVDSSYLQVGEGSTSCSGSTGNGSFRKIILVKNSLVSGGVASSVILRLQFRLKKPIPVSGVRVVNNFGWNVLAVGPAAAGYYSLSGRMPSLNLTVNLPSQRPEEPEGGGGITVTPTSRPSVNPTPTGWAACWCDKPSCVSYTNNLNGIRCSWDYNASGLTNNCGSNTFCAKKLGSRPRATATPRPSSSLSPTPTQVVPTATSTPSGINPTPTGWAACWCDKPSCVSYLSNLEGIRCSQNYDSTEYKERCQSNTLCSRKKV